MAVRRWPASSSKRYRVIAADLPGLGDSGDAESYDKRTLAQHLRKLLADLKATPGHIVGHDKAVFSEARIDRYVQAYSKPSSLHAGFEYYRAFEKDAVDNQDHESAKLTMPVLSIGGGNSRLNKYVVDQLRAGTTRLTEDLAPQSGHWIPEEQPEWLATRLMEFIAAH